MDQSGFKRRLETLIPIECIYTNIYILYIKKSWYCHFIINFSKTINTSMLYKENIVQLAKEFYQMQ